MVTRRHKLWKSPVAGSCCQAGRFLVSGPARLSLDCDTTHMAGGMMSLIRGHSSVCQGNPFLRSAPRSTRHHTQSCEVGMRAMHSTSYRADITLVLQSPDSPHPTPHCLLYTGTSYPTYYSYHTPHLPYHNTCSSLTLINPQTPISIQKKNPKSKTSSIHPTQPSIQLPLSPMLSADACTKLV